MHASADRRSYSPPTVEDDAHGLVAFLVLCALAALAVVVPLCLSGVGAVRLFRWAASPIHSASPAQRRVARVAGVVLPVVVWGAAVLGAASLWAARR